MRKKKIINGLAGLVLGGVSGCGLLPLILGGGNRDVLPDNIPMNAEVYEQDVQTPKTIFEFGVEGNANVGVERVKKENDGRIVPFEVGLSCNYFPESDEKICRLTIGDKNGEEDVAYTSGDFFDYELSSPDEANFTYLLFSPNFWTLGSLDRTEFRRFSISYHSGRSPFSLTGNVEELEQDVDQLQDVVGIEDNGQDMNGDLDNHISECSNDNECIGSGIVNTYCNAQQNYVITTYIGSCVGGVCVRENRDEIIQCQYGCGLEGCLAQQQQIGGGAIIINPPQGGQQGPLPVACSGNGQCDDGNPLTTDICRNSGGTNSYCENVRCFADSECGDVSVGSPFCSDDLAGIVQTFTGYTCASPGTIYSACIAGNNFDLETACGEGLQCDESSGVAECVQSMPTTQCIDEDAEIVDQTGETVRPLYVPEGQPTNFFADLYISDECFNEISGGLDGITFSVRELGYEGPGDCFNITDIGQMTRTNYGASVPFTWIRDAGCAQHFERCRIEFTYIDALGILNTEADTEDVISN